MEFIHGQQTDFKALVLDYFEIVEVSVIPMFRPHKAEEFFAHPMGALQSVAYPRRSGGAPGWGRGAGRGGPFSGGG